MMTIQICRLRPGGERGFFAASFIVVATVVFSMDGTGADDHVEDSFVVPASAGVRGPVSSQEPAEGGTTNEPAEAGTTNVNQQPASDAGERAEFFEKKIRPGLVEQCYQCHNSTRKAEGGLALDQREAALRGGDGGAIIVPGKPTESRLLAILRHEVDGMKMPQGGPQLDNSVIADFEQWIRMGAPDPRDKPPTVDELTQATSWEAVFEKRKAWWSFQPVRRVEPPAVRNPGWSEHPVDRFVLARLEEHGLQPATRADRRTLLRRYPSGSGNSHSARRRSRL